MAKRPSADGHAKQLACKTPATVADLRAWCLAAIDLITTLGPDDPVRIYMAIWRAGHRLAARFGAAEAAAALAPPHAGTSFIDEMAAMIKEDSQRLPEKLAVLIAWCERQNEKETPEPAAKAGDKCAVVLHGPDKEPVVLGKERPKLWTARFNVIRALIDAGKSGLTKDQLAAKSGHSDAVGILKRLAASDPDFWGKAILLPRTTGQHYRLLFE